MVKKNFEVLLSVNNTNDYELLKQTEFKLIK